MLRCSTSLWSADLANLAAEIARVEPYSDRFHLDVADGHYVPEMLFFPALVAALRPHTRLPFEVHLMTTDPLRWIEPFCDAGADVVIFANDSATDPAAVVDAIASRGRRAGISLLLTEPVDAVSGLLDRLDVLTICGTEMGIKGAEMDPSTPARIRQARQAITAAGSACLVQADGGIRRHTVPQIAAAGADYIVPGSLMFGGEPSELREWLSAL
jgi:ribulose-phosphate 3-epimerase